MSGFACSVVIFQDAVQLKAEGLVQQGCWLVLGIYMQGCKALLRAAEGRLHSQDVQLTLLSSALDMPSKEGRTAGALQQCVTPRLETYQDQLLSYATPPVCFSDHNPREVQRQLVLEGQYIAQHLQGDAYCTDQRQYYVGSQSIT